MTIAMNSQVDDPEAIEVDLSSSIDTMEDSADDEQMIVSGVPEPDEWSESQGEDAVSYLSRDGSFCSCLFDYIILMQLLFHSLVVASHASRKIP